MSALRGRGGEGVHTRGKPEICNFKIAIFNLLKILRRHWNMVTNHSCEIDELHSGYAEIMFLTISFQSIKELIAAHESAGLKINCKT